MTKAEKEQFKQNPHAFKLRYLYRELLLEFQPLSPDSPIQPRVDLSRIHTSTHTLSLILTYHLNYGISARKTATMMRDIRMNGKWHYLFFFFDATKKIILSYRTSPNRDTLSAIDDVLQSLFEQLHLIYLLFVSQISLLLRM